MIKHSFMALLFFLLESSVFAQMAQGQAKFLGNILGNSQYDPDFATYWNQVTVENSGKWGSVEPTRGQMEWSELDTIYHYAQNHGFPFKQHNFIWGERQPSWMDNLPQQQQKLETTRWISQYG